MIWGAGYYSPDIKEPQDRLGSGENKGAAHVDLEQVQNGNFFVKAAPVTLIVLLLALFGCHVLEDGWRVRLLDGKHDKNGSTGDDENNPAVPPPAQILVNKATNEGTTAG